MGRIFNVILVLMMIGGAAATYDLKHRASGVAHRVARLNDRIGKEKEAMALLKAEWSVLSQPSRLQAIITRYHDHFKLEPFSVDQVATLDEIPVKPDTVTPSEPLKAVADASRPLR